MALVTNSTPLKLLDKTLWVLLLISILAVTGSGGLQYYLTKSKIEAKVDQRLNKEKRLIKEQLKDIQPEVGFSYNTARSTVRFVEDGTINCRDSIYNGQLVDEDGEEIFYRILNTCIELKTGTFRVEIKKEKEETATFIGSIFFTHFIILLAVIVIVVLFKYFYLKNVWSPFFTTLNQIKKVDIQNNRMNFDVNTGVREFNELNLELQELSDTVYLQYQAQKSFTANASHELMTPIAVVRNKMELLVQSESLGENELRLIGEVLPKLDRLAKINKSLILLSKISHHHFDDYEEVDMVEQFNDVLNYFEDQIRLKGVQVRKNISNDLIAHIHPDLAHILMMNLVKNAVLHNLENGWLKAEVNGRKFTLVNTGNELSVAPEELFGRFSTDSENPDSIGLGLAIISDIAQLYGVELDYSVHGNEHIFTLTFPALRA